MAGSPLDPLVNALTGLALTIGGAALVTVSIVSFLRWAGLHWSWALPGVALWPALWWVDPGAAGFAAATSLFATVTGAREDRRIGGAAPRRAGHVSGTRR